MPKSGKLECLNAKLAKRDLESRALSVFGNKGIRDAGSTADFRILFVIFEILEI